MAFSQNTRARLSYITETTYGTTPAGTFKVLPITSHSLDLTKERLQGNDLQADRMTRVDRHGNRQTSGDITADLRKGDFDPLLESAMLNAWATNTLKVGTTPKYFTFEDYAADIDQARKFTGTTVSQASFSLAPNQMITSTFNLVGKNMTTGAVEAVAPTAPSTNAPFDTYSGDLAIGNVGASSSSAIVSAVDFSINNNFTHDFVIGNDSAPNLNYGMATIEGSFTAYYQDSALIDRFVNEVETELSVSVDDPTGANPYTFLFPRVKINGAAVPVGGTGSRMITMPFVALFDTTEASSLVITRTV